MLDLLVDEYRKFLDWKEISSLTRNTKEEFHEFCGFQHEKDASFKPFVTSPRNQPVECANEKSN